MTTPQRQRAYAKGITSEKIAAGYLRQNGYQILEERYKTRYGEIDIIAAQDEFLIAVEVKARNTLEEALEAVTYKSRKRIEKAMLYFMAQNPHHCDAAIRFDVIAISAPMTIHHLDNAWQPEA